MSTQVPRSRSESQASNIPASEGPRDYVGGISWAIFAATILAWLGLWWANSQASESRWLIPLFGLPLLGEFIGSVVLFHRSRRDKKLSIFRWFYLGIMSLCIGSFQAFWLAYILYKINQPPLSPRSLAALALFSVAMLVGLVIIMTLAIMCRPPRERRDQDGFFARGILAVISVLHNLKAGAAQEPFLALLLFFTVFLGVSYLFGFTFAFHDKSLPLPERALYMKKFSGLKNTRPSINTAASSFRFQFDSFQAIPDIESNQSNLQTELEPLAERKRTNFESLEAVVKHITQVPPDDALRVIVVGHADDAVPKEGPYPSNYDLSQARAENVRRKIIERLATVDYNRWRNIEWICLSSSNEAEPLKLVDVVKQLRTTKGGRMPSSAYRSISHDVSEAEERFADVRIDQPWSQPSTVQMEHFQSELPKSPDLLDYIYFANYTITTTGYGDIIPLTPFAKFICSLANICEVFFLVVFFNALLSLRVESEGKSPSSPLGTSSHEQGEELDILKFLVDRVNNIEQTLKKMNSDPSR